MTVMEPGPSGLPPLLENGTRPRSVSARVRDVWTYRELLVNLTRRELKVKYKNSVLGFLWTLLNPLLYLAVFSVVFGSFLRTAVPLYGIFLLSGLLTWNVFSIGTTSATTSIVANGPLVQKVWFPREILPLAAVGAALINFFFQFTVLAVGLVVFWHPPAWHLLPLLVPALLVTVLLATALGLMLSAVNVYLRDVQHFLELAFLAWFWLTPIVYQYDFIADSVRGRLGEEWERLVLLNPMIAVTTTFQRVIYNPSPTGDPATDPFLLLFRPATWYLTNLAIVGVVALVLLYAAIRVFGRLEANLGEEI
jgi:ABC-2 type transport system permease protein